ncbi:MAG: aldolase [Chloroflexi bacterium]|nr:aldolase [Chloroflexota bacterium]
MPRERLNRLIQLFEEGTPAFGAFMPNDSIEDAAWAAESDLDFVIIDMEHSGFDYPGLRTTLQYLLSRRQLAGASSLAPRVTPLARIPPNSRERNQWVIKQTLDYGVYGVVLPHVNTPEEAIAWTQAARYPQRRDAPDYEPLGLRGTAPFQALRYWGLSYPEYYARADLWPLDPEGDILLMGLVEEEEGVRNIREVLRRARGIGAIFLGEVDLSVSLGHPWELGHPVVAEARDRVLMACKEAGVPCGCLVTPQNVEERLEMGFRFLVGSIQRSTPFLEIGRRRVGR